MDQVSIKYANTFHCKTLQNLPKFGFWFENEPSGNPAVGTFTTAGMSAWSDETDIFIHFFAILTFGMTQL
jgi:hypothetical protein